MEVDPIFITRKDLDGLLEKAAWRIARTEHIKLVRPETAAKMFDVSVKTLTRLEKAGVIKDHRNAFMEGARYSVKELMKVFGYKD